MAKYADDNGGKADEPSPIVALDRALAAAFAAESDVRICPSGSGYTVFLDSVSGSREWTTLDWKAGHVLVVRAKIVGELDLSERVRAQSSIVDYTVEKLTFRMQVVARPGSGGGSILMRRSPSDTRPHPAAFVSNYDERLTFDILFAVDWLGGDKRDPNVQWRGRVIDYCLEHPADVPGTLWVDLLREETFAGVEYCGVRDSYRSLVRACMNRCDPVVAVDLLHIVCSASFDTFMICRGLDWCPETRARLLPEARERLATARTTTDRQAVLRWEGVIDSLEPAVTDGEATDEEGADEEAGDQELQGLMDGTGDGESPSTRWANRIMEFAEAMGATSVYLNPQKDGTLEIQFHDGENLRPCPDGSVPMTLRPVLTSKLKKLARLDVAEKRTAQQGSFTTTFENGTTIVWDVSIEPTILGEELTLRLHRRPDAHSVSDQRIKLACIGECEQNPVHYLRDAYGVDGTVYRIYHRGGWLSVTRFAGSDADENDLLVDRGQGGPSDSAGSDEDVLAATADIFELNLEGESCRCGAVYPADLVPMECYRCHGFLRFSHVVSLGTGADITVPPVSREFGEMRLARKYIEDLEVSRVQQILDTRHYDQVWEMLTETDDAFWIIMSGGILMLVVPIGKGRDVNETRLVDCLSSEGFTDLDAALGYAAAMFAEYIAADLELIECEPCRRFRTSVDAPCPHCGSTAR